MADSTKASAQNPHALLTDAIAGVTTETLKDLSGRLIELQESQHTLVSTITAKSSELLGNSPEWAAARDILEKLPEYRAKVDRMRRAMGGTLARLERVEQGAATLRGKVEDKEAERAQRKSADIAGYASVAAR